MASKIMDHFSYEHLPEKLQEVSKPIGDLARQFDATLPDGPEKSAGLRKLLEAKDCLVRAAREVPKKELALLTREQIITLVKQARDEEDRLYAELMKTDSRLGPRGERGHPMIYSAYDGVVALREALRKIAEYRTRLSYTDHIPNDRIDPMNDTEIRKLSALIGLQVPMDYEE